jgi:hypothetical protein
VPFLVLVTLSDRSVRGYGSFKVEKLGTWRIIAQERVVRLGTHQANVPRFAGVNTASPC